MFVEDEGKLKGLFLGKNCRNKFALTENLVYSSSNTPAMPLFVREHAHSGGFFIALSCKS